MITLAFCIADYFFVMSYKFFNRAVLRISLCAAAFSVFVSASADKRDFDLMKNVEVFNSIVKELNTFYVDSIDADKVIGNGIKSMLYSLDPYTNYIPEERRDDMKFITTGEYAGIGALIGLRDDSLVYISDVYAGNPAYTDGLRVGDVIVAVDGEKVVGRDTEYVSNRLRGKSNTVVKVSVSRPGTEGVITVPVTRKKIYVPAVSYYGVIADGVGYIYLTNFNDKSADEVKSALTDLMQNKGISSLVLDLRDNPGGILDEAIEVVNLFVPKGKTVLETRGKVKQWDRVYKTTQKPVAEDMPLVVLVNGESASASEIVSGALQDMDRAVIVGERTYGKGLVQSTRPLPYGGILKVTTSKYYIPSGRLIQAIDYSHRNNDGSAERIPDSATNEFRTAAGRVVRDGGGIVPDVTVPAEKESNILYYMMRDLVIFDFVSDYRVKHPTIAPVDEFVFTDEDYEEFKAFVKARNFDYDRNSDKLLSELKKVADFEGYMEDAAETFALLEKQLAHDIDKDFVTFEKDLREAVVASIIHRYYLNEGAIRQVLKDDDYAAEGVKLLNDPARYKSLLEPAKGKGKH